MNDPKRLLDSDDPLESLLLSSATDDAPPRGLRRSVHVALGVGGAAIGAGTTTTAAAAASKATPLLASLGVAKWAGIVAIGTSTVVGAAVLQRAASTTPAATRTAVAAEPRGAQGVAPVRALPRAPLDIPPPPAIVEAPPSSPPVAHAEPAVAPPPAAEPRVTAPVAQTLPPKASTPTQGPELADELALLDRAHAAIAAGDSPRALEALDRHDLEFMSGDLAPEALALRIEAYALRHDAVKVTELGQAFLAKYPAHPQARHVESLIRAAR